MEKIYNPDLSDLLDLHKKDIMNTLNCHAIATVQEFNPETKTCKATLNYKKSIVKRNPITGKYQDVLEDYPVLIDCPVIAVGGGSTGIRFPVEKGDTCLVMFNDRDIDNWFNGLQSNGAVATKRVHNFSDGIVLVGIFSKGDAAKDYESNADDYDSEKTFWFNGTTKIALSDTDMILEKGTSKVTVNSTGIIIQKGAVKITVGAKVKIENAVGSLNPILQQLFADYFTLPQTFLSTSPGNPIVAGPGTPALLASINANLIKLQGLLE